MSFFTIPYSLAAVLIWIWILSLLAHAFLFLAWVCEIRKAVNRTLDELRLIETEVGRISSGSRMRKSS